MKVGLADYGLTAWDGGCFDISQRLSDLKSIGYDGIERLEASSADHALQQSALFRRLGMDFGTCRGPTVELSINWTAGLGKKYLWATANAKDMGSFCRQATIQAQACARFGLRLGVHNHLGQVVETTGQINEFLSRCPDCGLILDTGHLVAAGGDPVEMINAHADRLVAVHVKDWLVTDPDIGLDQWTRRGRFCELGGGNSGQDHHAVIQALRQTGYAGWVFVEHDTHVSDPLAELAISRDYLRQSGI